MEGEGPVPGPRGCGETEDLGEEPLPFPTESL